MTKFVAGQYVELYPTIRLGLEAASSRELAASCVAFLASEQVTGAEAW